MKKHVLAILLTLVSVLNLYAQQKQGAWWYFGDKAGLNFNTEPPSPDFAGQSNSYQGCASVSDADGNLLFYADGMNVYNKLHQIMPNGSGINLPGSNGPTNVMIVKKPGSDFLYYLFAITPFAVKTTPNFSYSIIDIRLNGGKGDVVSSAKTVVIFPTHVARRLTIAMHANNQDVWIITRSYVGNNYYSFLVTQNGIAPPVVTSIGALDDGDYVGFLKASPNSEFLCDATSSGSGNNRIKFVQLMDLNRSSGILSNLRTFPFSGNGSNPYGIAFSPDNSKLYLSNVRYVYQYNLQAGSFSNVLASKTTLPTDSTIWHYDMQLGMNGKIYLTNTNSFYSPFIPNLDKYLGVINCPNALGSACGYQDTAVYLGRYSGGVLPALNQTLFRNANFLQLTAPETYTCIGKPIKLSAFGAGADHFTWLPANGLTPNNSPEIMVSPTVTTTYTVIGYSQCDSDTASITINVVPPAFANAGPDRTICATEMVQLGAFPQNGFTYAWNTSPFLSDTVFANPIFTANNNTTSDQVYQLILTIDGPGVACGKSSDTVLVTVKPPIIANAGANLTSCSGVPIQLSPQQFNSNYTYSWSPATGLNNANSFAPTVNLRNFSAQPDTVFYTLTATDSGCSDTSQVRVVILPEPKPVIYGPASVCPGSPQIAYVIQNPQTGINYTWGVKGGSISQAFPDSIQVNWGNTNANAQVWVLAQNSFSCKSDTVFFPVTVNPLLLTEKPKGNSTICNTDRKNQTYQIARSQGSTYTWGISGGTILNGQNSNRITVNWNWPGQHKLWVQESAQTTLAQCYGVSDTLRVTVLPSPDTTVTIQGPKGVCLGTSQTYYYSAGPGSTYTWAITGGAITGGVGTSMINVNWRRYGLGEIKVQETYASGCVGPWKSLTVQVDSIPQPTLIYNNFFCPESLTRTHQVKGSPGSTFQWQATGGTILSGQGTDLVTIQWDSLSTRKFLSVSEISAMGCARGFGTFVEFDRSKLELASVGLDDSEANLLVQYRIRNPLWYNWLKDIFLQTDNQQNNQWQTLGQYLGPDLLFSVPATEFDLRNYRLQSKNNCDTDVFSTSHRPVKLSAAANEKSGEVYLTWNAYKGWRDTVLYEIWQKAENETQFSILTATLDSSITLKMSRNGFQQSYRVKAISKTGDTSWSNSVGLIFENALDFPNVITPNNDGLNETFTAASLKLYPNSSLKIYNRYGKEVYQSQNYQGTWKGENVSNGTYYYLLQTAAGKSFKGWVEVVK